MDKFEELVAALKSLRSAILTPSHFPSFGTKLKEFDDHLEEAERMHRVDQEIANGDEL